MPHQKGFTLIELMIVVVILGILVSILYPSYQNYIIRKNRIETQTTMMEIAQNLQSYKLANGDYGKSNSNASYATNPLLNPLVYGSSTAPKNELAKYNLTITNTPDKSWVLTAQPISTTAQKDNGALTINHEGIQCWYKSKDSPSTTDPCFAWSDK